MPKTLTKKIIAHEIRQLLQLPYDATGNNSKAIRITNIVLKAIADLVLKYGHLQIMGFGTFYIYDKPAKKCSVNTFYNHKPGKRWSRIMPSYRVVKFRPSGTLKRFVDLGVVNE